MGNAMKRKTKKRVKMGTTAASKEVRRKLFVQSLIANGENRTQAAIDAGYAERSAAVAGSRMLKEPKTIQLLAEARGKLQAQFGLTAENVARQLAAIVNYDPRMMFDNKGAALPINQWPDAVAFAVAGLETSRKDGEAAETITKHKVWDKNAGIGHAMKALGMSMDRVSIEVPPTTADGEINMLDAARRVAFLLAQGAALVKKGKQPA